MHASNKERSEGAREYSLRLFLSCSGALHVVREIVKICCTQPLMCSLNSFCAIYDWLSDASARNDMVAHPSLSLCYAVISTTRVGSTCASVVDIRAADLLHFIGTAMNHSCRCATPRTLHAFGLGDS